jgi:hypothetical protein
VVSVEALAEAINASPGYHGQPVFALFCNEFENTGRPVPYLPLQRALADELKMLNPTKDIRVVGSSTIVGILGDGRGQPVTNFSVRPPFGDPIRTHRTLLGDQYYEIQGRGDDDPLTLPQPFPSPFTPSPDPTVPPGSTEQQVHRRATPEYLSWPVSSNSGLASADYWAAMFKLTPRQQRHHRALVDASFAANYPNVGKRGLVNLTAYLTDKQNMDQAALTPDGMTARSLIRAAAAVAHRLLPPSTAPAYLTVNVPTGQTVEEARTFSGNAVAAMLAAPTAEMLTLSTQRPTPTGSQMVVEVPAELLRDLRPLNLANQGITDEALLHLRQPMTVVTDGDGTVRLAHARVLLPKTEVVANPLGPVLWLREDGRAGPNSVEREAARKMQLPAGAVGLMVRGQNGLPTLDGKPVSVATLKWLLEQQPGMANKPIFLGMCATPATVAYAREMTSLTGQPVRIASADFWVNTVTGKTVTANATLRADGHLHVPPGNEGQWLDIAPNSTAPPIPSDGGASAGFDGSPAGGQWVHWGQKRAGNRPSRGRGTGNKRAGAAAPTAVRRVRVADDSQPESPEDDDMLFEDEDMLFEDEDMLFEDEDMLFEEEDANTANDTEVALDDIAASSRATGSAILTGPVNVPDFLEAHEEYEDIRGGRGAEAATIAGNLGKAWPRLLRELRELQRAGKLPAGVTADNVDEVLRPLTAGEVYQVWQHLFGDEHELPGEPMSSAGSTSSTRHFDAHPEIARAWRRLSDANRVDSIDPFDLVLLWHELVESGHMGAGMSYDSAHAEANKLYNWQREVLVVLC